MSEEKGRKTAEENRRLRKKKNLPVFVRTRKQRAVDGRFREEIKGKIKREQLHKEQKKQAGRLLLGMKAAG